MAFSPDGTRIATGSPGPGATLKVRDATKMKLSPSPVRAAAPPLLSEAAALAGIKRLGGRFLATGFKASWSPDGQRICFGQLTPQVGGKIRVKMSVLDLKSGKATDLIQPGTDPAWCTIPEAELAKKCFFYIDDVSLEVIEEPPLAISTPLDEYYSGETIPWAVNSTSSSGQIRIALLAGERLVAEQAGQAGSGPLRGTFAGGKLTPGIYTLQATLTAPQQAPLAARRQVIVAPDPFGW